MQKKNLVEQIIKFNLMSIIPCHFNYFLPIITRKIYIFMELRWSKDLEAHKLSFKDVMSIYIFETYFWILKNYST